MSGQPTDPYVEYLREEGYAPKTEDNGNVLFKYEGWTYLIMADRDDPQYFRLVLPNITTASDEASRREAIDAANHATATTKVAKIFVLDDGVVHGTVELLADSPASIINVFKRSLQTLQAAAQRFVQRLQES